MQPETENCGVRKKPYELFKKQKEKITLNNVLYEVYYRLFDKNYEIFDYTAERNIYFELIREKALKEKKRLHLAKVGHDSRLMYLIQA